MAGLLDLFGGEDPQQQGLLGLTSGILGASGPSRMPVSLGQVLGAGFGGFQEAQRSALAQQAARQNMAINSIKLKDAESDLQNQEALRQRTANLQKDSAEFWKTGGQPAPAFPGGQSASTMMGNAVSMNGTPVPQPALDAPTSPVPAGRNATPYQQRLAYAQFLRSKGYSAEAQAEEDSALKLQPKVKGWEKVQQGGKVMFAPFFEDGTSGAPVPLEVAEKLEFKNTGGKTLGLNPFTGAQVASYANTVDPNTAYTGNITMRGQNMTDARARDANRIAANKNVIETSTGLRKEFEALPEVKNFKQALPAYQAIEDAATRNTTQSDINLVYGIAKLYDPNSVVREGEYNTVANSPNIPERIKGYAQYLSGGGRLTPEVKNQILAEARGRMQTFDTQYQGARSDFENIAGNSGASPKLLFPSERKPAVNKPADAQPASSNAGKKFDMLPPASQYEGKRMRADNGTVYRAVGGKWVKE